MKKLVLLGAGHANLEIIKHLSARARAFCDVTIISRSKKVYYSGLLPRLILGEIQEDHLTIDVEAFCKSRNVRFILSSAKRIVGDENEIQLENDETVKYDHLVINTGGVTKGIPTENSFRTLSIKPLEDFVERWREIQRICSACQKLNFVVVGGGAASVELAIALKLRLMNNQSVESQVAIITSANRIGENYAPNISHALEKSLVSLGIALHFNEKISRIPTNELRLASGLNVPFDYVFVSLPVVPPEWNFKQNLNIDQEGFFLVDDYLRCSSNVYAVGDCSKMKSFPILPKSGVIAVRQGQYLAKHFSQLLLGNSFEIFRPKRRQLNLLVTGTEEAALVYGNLSFKSGLSYKIKKLIDQRYIQSFRV